VLPIVWKAVLNLITKAATSPFSLLGAAFGGGEELSFVSFEPGRADIPEAESKKLDKLAKALFERPGLSLEIIGAVDPSQDRQELARLKLLQEIKALRAQELSKPDETPPAVESLVIEPAEQHRLLATLFFQCAETNRALLPETNQMAQVTDTNSVPLAKPSSTNAVPASAPEPSRVSAPKKRYFSSEKGATLLRMRRAPAQSISPVAEPGTAALQSPPVETSTPAERSSTLDPVALAESLGLTAETMETRLLPIIEISDAELLDLEKRRAEAVRTHLLQGQQIAEERLFVQPPKDTVGSGPGDCKVHLSLN
jgi:hypothetical protein